MDVGTFCFMLFAVGEHSVESVPGVEMALHLLPGVNYAQFHLTPINTCARCFFLVRRFLYIRNHQEYAEYLTASSCVKPINK